MMDNRCRCSSDRLLNPILFNILSQLDNTRSSLHDYNSIPHRCNCELRRTVCLKRPLEICKEASSVLLKTVHFMKNLPAFKQLPPNDQFILLKNCWVPLFILGLAQEHVDFEVADVPADSMLKKILLRREGGTEMEREQPTIAGVSKLKSCLRKFWSLDLSPKEYAYLKGTTIFNPDIPDLKASLFIEGLQQEAQHALSEVVQLLHPRRQDRFARILLTASMLQSITPSLIVELLLRPVIGQADLLELLVDMLFGR
ncbi:nuclear receptor subfamily 0 group B member 2a [Hippocampus zosterae]|uniref:nuclear receptor subfamily 0 group B member 2a n=1 Tax=Hippocampus zosterae TaxID=109293 RepID=UPI00223CF946|nr:nuclear receptor subfamily 0 group B member 2a [Hippocampus zosterae]